MDLAKMAATRSTCDRASVGCVIVKDQRILSTGYNGSIKGLPHCDEVGHLLIGGSCVRGLHAEENAIASAAKHGVSIDGCTVYITHFPCWRCFRSLVQAGTEMIVYDTFEPYTDAEKEAGIHLELHKAPVQLRNIAGASHW